MDQYQVKSDLSTAARHATAIGDANFLQMMAITRDSQTTVAGNSNATAGISNVESLQGQLGAHITSIIQNVHSVAAEFEDKDAMIRQSLTTNYLPPKKEPTVTKKDLGLSTLTALEE